MNGSIWSGNQITAQLAEMGAPQDSVVLVHTSMRAVGAVEGRAEGLLDSLIAYFTADGGLLCIPTHTWANFAHKEKITLDKTTGETCIGILPSIAAVDPRGTRTSHPSHSMAVFGDPERVAAFIEGEDRRVTPASPNGCYGKICTMGGKILLIGVGHNRNTYLHSVEEMLDVPNRLSKEPREVTVRHENGEIERRLVYSHKAEGIRDVSAQYPKYEPAFRLYGAIVDGFIGNAEAQLCDARIMREVLALVRERSGGRELLADDEALSPSLYRK